MPKIKFHGAEIEVATIEEAADLIARLTGGTPVRRVAKPPNTRTAAPANGPREHRPKVDWSLWIALLNELYSVGQLDTDTVVARAKINSKQSIGNLARQYQVALEERGMKLPDAIDTKSRKGFWVAGPRIAEALSKLTEKGIPL